MPYNNNEEVSTPIPSSELKSIKLKRADRIVLRFLIDTEEIEGKTPLALASLLYNFDIFKVLRSLVERNLVLVENDQYVRYYKVHPDYRMYFIIFEYNNINFEHDNRVRYSRKRQVPNYKYGIYSVDNSYSLKTERCAKCDGYHLYFVIRKKDSGITQDEHNKKKAS